MMGHESPPNPSPRPTPRILESFYTCPILGSTFSQTQNVATLSRDELSLVRSLHPLQFTPRWQHTDDGASAQWGVPVVECRLGHQARRLRLRWCRSCIELVVVIATPAHGNGRRGIELATEPTLIWITIFLNALSARYRSNPRTSNQTKRTKTMHSQN